MSDIHLYPPTTYPPMDRDTCHTNEHAVGYASPNVGAVVERGVAVGTTAIGRQT